MGAIWLGSICASTTPSLTLYCAGVLPPSYPLYINGSAVTGYILLCDYALALTISGIWILGWMTWGIIIGSISYNGRGAAPSNKLVTPPQIMPNPHSIPNRARRKPQQNKGSRQIGEQHSPFFYGGSVFRAKYLRSDSSIEYSLGY